MSKIQINQFTQYTQSVDEQLYGSCYSTEQLQFIQNQIATASYELLALVPEPNNYPAYIQQQAYKRGQLDAYQYLIDCHEASQQALLTKAQQSQE
jgi:hypothetical protein